ncbi:seed lectin-like [Benincasa hispida]|uniref:seed lectin-like n=1 Tax=Benincasa hispida TaxID=102211 RepID=UPI0018FF8345|nr:seed lectin-like [Benincasa hispida]
MRSLVLYIVVFLSLATCTIEGNQLSLSSLDSYANDYKHFIQAIRDSLTQNTYQLYGIPVLKKVVPPFERFTTFTLTNEIDETITLAIDKVNLGVVGYLSNNISYMFLNAPREAFRVVFPSTCRVILDFDSDYKSIEIAASTTRQEIVLGFDPMDVAISTLFHYQENSIPKAFLVILQMVIEGLKFKFIEQSVFMSLKYRYNFKPSLAIVSLQDNWVRLSSQIQASSSLQGLFGEVIELYDSNDKIIRVDAIDYPIILTNIAMQLYHCNVSTNIIKMTVQNDSCYIQSHSTRISGRAGLCADVKNGFSNDGNPIILYPCGQQANQNWTFQRDGTIQSLGKCLTFNDTNFVVIYNCSKVAPSTIKWKVSIDGTISHPSSGLVLTANSPAANTKLKMEANTQTFSQCWRVGNYIEPIVGSIIGFYGVCLEATNDNTNLKLADCVKNKRQQYWALYGDGTIRVNSSRNLCVSSSSSDCIPGRVVTVLKCNGGSNQRWYFNVNGSIMNPKCGMGMDVDTRWNDIILYPKTGEATQQWYLFY